MGRLALIAILIAWTLDAFAASALGDAGLRIPPFSCDAAHVDLVLLRNLLIIELGGTNLDDRHAQLELTVDPAICNADAMVLELVVRDLASSRLERITETIPETGDLETRARVLSLALADRVRHTIDRFEGLRATSVAVEPSMESTTQGQEAPPSPWSVGLSSEGRLTPTSGTWTLGMRADVTWRWDPAWRLRIDAGAAGSHGTTLQRGVLESEVDLVLATAGAALGLTIFDSSGFDLHGALRAEFGVVALFTRFLDEFTGSQSVPFGTLGFCISGAWWIQRAFALSAEFRLSAVVFGVREVTLTGNPIDLSIVTLDLLLGVRFGT